MAIGVLSNRGFTVHISLFFMECLGLIKHQYTKECRGKRVLRSLPTSKTNLSKDKLML